MACYNKKEILEYTNFIEARLLKSHHANTYVNEGIYSIAFSEPTRIKNTSWEYIKELPKTNLVYDNNIEFIIDFSKMLDSSIAEHHYFNSTYELLNEKIDKYRQYELLYYLNKISNFMLITGLRWMVTF